MSFATGCFDLVLWTAVLVIGWAVLRDMLNGDW